MSRVGEKYISLASFCLAISVVTVTDSESQVTFKGFVFADSLASFAFSDTVQSETPTRTPLWNADVTIYSEVRSDSSFHDWAGFARTERSGWFGGRLTPSSVFTHLGAIVVRRNTFHTDTVFFKYSSASTNWNFTIGLRKIDDPNIERAQAILATRDSGVFSFQRRSRSEWNDAERFLRYIATPLHNTTFYLFTTDWMSPGIMSIFCAFRDTLQPLPRISNESSYADIILIAFLNSRLHEEAVFDSSSVYRLATSYNDLLSDGIGSYQMLNSSVDIRMPEGQLLPEQIKNMIHPLSVRAHQGGYSATFFVRNIYSARLFNVLLTYAGKKMTVTFESLGKFGFIGARL